MRNVWIIFRKEMRSYFVSPIAYFLLTMFALVSAFFCSSAGATRSAPSSPRNGNWITCDANGC